MQFLIENEGYTTLLAESVEDAIKSIHKKIPDLILLDLQMPQVSGYDFLKMREDLHIQNVPIIVVSAYDTKENIELTKKLGAIEFLSKPIKTNLLTEIIKQYLKK
jgi:CheY-like chemotaxis protein